MRAINESSASRIKKSLRISAFLASQRLSFLSVLDGTDS